MKKYLAILTILGMLESVVPVSAQENQDTQQAQSAPLMQDATQPQDSASPQDSGSTQDVQQPEVDPQQQAAEQPGVARMSFIRGDVSLQRGDSGDWIAVTINSPVSVGDSISTGAGARAEFQLDYADVLRLSENATAKIANISRSQIQVQIGQGLATYTVLKGAEATSELDTPNIAIRPTGEGEYRIIVNSESETQVIVRRGSADISTSQGSTHVDRGQMITIQGTDNPQYQTASAPGSDEWDSWNNNRDGIINNAQSLQKTNRYYVGAQDLDAYGQWTNVPDYGNVWVPTQNSDWAPYRDGRWVWEPYYGYTWVSQEPWGWAPYHYGRWFINGNSWAWWPGPVYASPSYYPIWSPAYVSFFGFGEGLGVGIGLGLAHAFGLFGWLPVGPGDWFHPWYGRFGGRFGAVGFERGLDHHGWSPLAGNRGRRFSNFDGALTNSRIRAGLSTMRASEFGRTAVPRHQETITAASFRQGKMMTGGVPITPTRASLSPTDRAPNRSTIRNRTGASQHFFAKSQPARVTPFREQSARVDRAIQSSRQSGAATQVGRTSANQNLHTNFATRVQEPRMQSSRANPSATAQSNARPGWHTFTPPASSSSRSHQNAASSNSRAMADTNSSKQRTFTPQPNRRSQPSQSVQNNGRKPTTGSQGEFQHFSPPTHQPEKPNATQARRPFVPPASSASRGSAPNKVSRPALNLHQPIVRPRGNSSSGYNAPRGSSSHANGAPRTDFARPQNIPHSLPNSHVHRDGLGGGSRHNGGSSSRGGGHSSHGGGGGHHSSGHSSGGRHHH